MKQFKLHELVDIFENEHETAVLWELVSPYKKQLYVYFSRFYRSEPILMVTSVTNNSSYCRVVPEQDFFDAVCAYMGECPDLEDEESESYGEYETICAYSRALKNML